MLVTQRKCITAVGSSNFGKSFHSQNGHRCACMKDVAALFGLNCMKTLKSHTPIHKTREK